MNQQRADMERLVKEVIQKKVRAINLVDISIKSLSDWLTEKFMEKEIDNPVRKRLERIGISDSSAMDRFLASADLTEIIDTLSPVEIYDFVLERVFRVVENILRREIRQIQGSQQSIQLDKVCLLQSDRWNVPEIHLSYEVPIDEKYYYGDLMKSKLRYLVQNDLLGIGYNPHDVVLEIESACIQLEDKLKHRPFSEADFSEIEMLFQYINKNLEKFVKFIMCFYVVVKMKILNQSISNELDSWNFWSIESYLMDDTLKMISDGRGKEQILASSVYNIVCLVPRLRRFRNRSVHETLSTKEGREYLHSLKKMIEQAKTLRLVSGYIQSVEFTPSATILSVHLDGVKRNLEVVYRKGSLSDYTVYKDERCILDAVGSQRVMLFPVTQSASQSVQPYMVEYAIFKGKRERMLNIGSPSKGRPWKYHELCRRRNLLFYCKIPIKIGANIVQHILPVSIENFDVEN